MEQHIESIEHKANPTVVAAYDGATAKEMFFTALSKLMKKQGITFTPLTLNITLIQCLYM